MPKTFLPNEIWSAPSVPLLIMVANAQFCRIWYDEVVMETVIKAPNFAGLLKKEHGNKWVAFSTDYREIIATGENLSELLDKAGKEDFAVVQVSENGFAGSIQ